MENEESFGLIREGDHLRPLGWSEYLRWVEKPLPRGWEIVYAPDLSTEQRRAIHLPRALGGQRVRSRATAMLIRLLGRKRWLRGDDSDLLVSEWRGNLYVIEERDLAVGVSRRARPSAPEQESEPDGLDWIADDRLRFGARAPETRAWRR